jgi:hypothetical protein
VIGVLILAALLEIYRSVGVIGLPDVGDPFDVAAFRAFRVPPDEDAFILLREAQEKTSRMPALSLTVRRAGPVAWSKVAPEMRDWLSQNRDALEKLLAAAERPDGIANPSLGRFGTHYAFYLGELVQLPLLEASRLEAQSDMAGAWNMYQAVLRIRIHVMRRGSVFQRFIAYQNCGDLRAQIAIWAADTRTTGALLRRALVDIKAAEPRSEWDDFSLKVEYLSMTSELDEDRGLVRHGEDEDQHVRVFGEELAGNLAESIYSVRRYIRHEPERSRRVLRLAFANWLAHVSDKDARLARPAVRAILRPSGRNSTVFLYRPGANAPDAASAVAPEKLAEWILSTLDARMLLSHWFWPAIRTTERREYHQFVVLLASELYKRDHGSLPASEALLVGPYLDRLADDGSSEVDDGTAATVRDDKATALGTAR